MKMKVPSGAYIYTDWPSYVDYLGLVKKDVNFYRNPSWLVKVEGYPFGAGVIWNDVTGFALRDEVMAVLRKRTWEKKPITEIWIKKVLPYRPGTNPYKYWPRF